MIQSFIAFFRDPLDVLHLSGDGGAGDEVVFVKKEEPRR